MKNLLKEKVLILQFGLLLFLLVEVAFFLSLPDGKLHLKVFDIGQGDSIFIETPNGYKILVDGGPDNSVIQQLSKSLAPWDRKIDFVVLTHPQSDHMFGLIEVVKRYQIGEIFYSGVTNSTQDYQNWLGAVKESHAKTQIVTAGENLSFPDQTEINFLWPKEEHPLVQDLNGAAIVFKLNFGSFSSLLTADADQQVQPYTSSIGQVDILKVPHHGSRTSLKPEFLSSLSPKVSIISVGAHNSYGHPNQQLLDLLKKSGTKIFRTDQNGTVEVVSDGKSWYTKTEKGN